MMFGIADLSLPLQPAAPRPLGYTIALGNAFDGITLIGFWSAQEDALEHAEDSYQGDDYFIIPVGVTA